MSKTSNVSVASLVLVFCMGFSSICYGQFGDSQWPDWHDTGFSETWPDWENDGHFWTHSSSWPPNHMGSISQAWGPRLGAGPEDHEFTVSEHEQWPPNHQKQLSKDWQTEEEPWWPSPGHRILGIDESVRHFHGQALSELWQDHPNHLIAVSSTWPGDHERSISRNWPANHNTTKSQTSVPTGPDGHQTVFSDDYSTDPAHLQTVSKYWPPNHLRAVSRSLTGSHNRAMSASYPPNHHHTISATWINNGGTWPANHGKAHSLDWGNPSDPGWPVFPSDHSWLSTAESLAGLIPSGGGSSSSGDGDGSSN